MDKRFMRKIIQDSTIKYYEGLIAKHTANVELIMNNPVSVAEHPDIIKMLVEEMSKLTNYRDQLTHFKYVFVDGGESIDPKG